MRTIHQSTMFALLLFGVITGVCCESGSAAQIARLTQPEAGSVQPRRRVRPAIPPREAGSQTRPRRDRAFPLPGQLPESGSRTRPRRGSVPEAGSIPVRPRSKTTRNRATTDRTDKTSGPASRTTGAFPAGKGSAGSETKIVHTTLIDWWLAGLLLLGFALIAWWLFQCGVLNPYVAHLWPKQLEMASELAMRVDDFLVAVHAKEFEKCQMVLEAIHHLNARRMLLMDNRVNETLSRFLLQAQDCRLPGDDQSRQDYLNELESTARGVMEALRGIARQSELSLSALRSWSETHQEQKLKTQDD